MNNSSPALTLPSDTSPSVVNMFRINKVADRLAWIAQPGNRGEPHEFYNLCLSLSRGIDYALANGETPPKAHDLPLLVKQICQLKNDECSQAAMMVLLISIKNACEIGWFQTKESEELVSIADEIGKVYSSLGTINVRPRSCSTVISTIMQKFYPKFKLGPILASIEAQPGYGASAVDFHITKSEVLKDKIFLLVAQTDNIETPACLISPQQVNFLLNGKGVLNRTNVQMDPGAQVPTNVTGMLKFGTNLLQAVGQFNGRYVVLVAYMSVTPLQEDPVLQDYLQPAVTSVDLDSDIIEGASRISLNCPISFTRIKTPVKGHSCKHFQCFDFDNFININSKRPSWRCPRCIQNVCYADIRLDRNMILKNVGENITEVIVFANGSWKAVLEKDHDVDKMQKKAPNCEKEQTQPQESTCPPSTVDLTKDDDGLDTVGSCDIVERKPPPASIHSHFVSPNLTSLGMNSTGVNQNVAAQTDDFWTGVYIGRSSSDTPTVGNSELPVLPDTVSPAFSQESAGRDNNPVVNSAMHNQFSGPSNLQMQMNHMNSVNEYGRSSSAPRHIHRTPVAVQALPVQSQALGPQQNSITNLNSSLLPSNSSAAPHISLSNPASVDTLNAILSDTERQQHFSRTPVNPPQVSGVNSPAFQHHTATQNRVPLINTSVPTQPQNQYRANVFSEFRNSHLQQALNRWPPPSTSSNTQWSHIQQSVPQSGNFQVAARGGALAARQGSSHARNVPTAGATTHRGMVPNQPARWTQSVSVQNLSTVAGTPFQGLTGEQRGNTAQSVSRPEELFSPQSEQNWTPTGRMRGSLDLSQLYDESIAQRIITPTQGQNSRPPGPQPIRRTGISSLQPATTQQDVLIANNRNANAHNRSSSR
ncbi:E3 SUMO-protein ligase pli1 [Glycine soja]|nr:E3 SUMO-protein ligase pli1 [Glycine soja]